MFPKLLAKSTVILKAKSTVILKYIHDNCCLIKKKVDQLSYIDNICIAIATNNGTTVQQSVLLIQFTYFINIILIIAYYLTIEIYSSQLVNIGYILSRNYLYTSWQNVSDP